MGPAAAHVPGRLAMRCWSGGGSVPRVRIRMGFSPPSDCRGTLGTSQETSEAADCFTWNCQKAFHFMFYWCLWFTILCQFQAYSIEIQYFCRLNSAIGYYKILGMVPCVCLGFILTAFLKKIFIFLAALGLSCSMWDLVPWPGIESRPPALGAQSLSHWTTREVPFVAFYCWVKYSQWSAVFKSRMGFLFSNNVGK